MAEAAHATDKDRERDPLGGTVLDSMTVATLDSERRGGGAELPGTVRRAMEDQLGADLGGVRVHTGSTADALAERVSARAFTVGSDIFFRQGVYAPQTPGGQHVLAHELSHVVQQHSAGGPAGAMTVGRADAPEEAEAERTATRVVANLRRSADAGRPRPATAGAADDSAAHTISRMVECGCGAHVVRRDPTDTVPARKPRPKGINLGSGGSGLVIGANRRAGVRLDGPLDLTQLADNDTAVDDPADNAHDVAAPEPEAPRKSELDQFLESMNDPGKNSLIDNIPSHFMGRFDAQYDPVKGVMLVTVRPRFKFTGKWTKSQQKDFVSKFVKQSQEKWTGKHEFACTKPGFERLKARVVVAVAPVEGATDRAHFECTIADEKSGDTFIGREQYNDPTHQALAQGTFAKQDAKERAHDNLKTRCTLAMHDLQRLDMFLTEFAPAKDDRGRCVITCTDTGLTDTDTAMLEKLVVVMNHSAELGATPLPIILTYHESGRDKAGKKRAEAIAKILRKIKHNPVKLVAATDEVKQLKKDNLKAIAEHGKDADKGYKAGGRYDTEAKQNIATRERELLSTNVTIHGDEAWAMSYKDSDPYSIVAHEFGHMLGNPDEYFGYGPQMLALKKSQLQASGNEADAVTAKNIKQSTLVTGDTDTIHGDWGKLVMKAGAELPTMTTKGSTASNSIMNAGAIVLPAHYATIWEALGRISAKGNPALVETDWKFA